MAYITDSFDEEVINRLKQGGVGFMPSDTIYGLSGLAQNEPAVKKIHSLKGRGQTKQYIILFSKITQLNELGIITTDVAAALRYWPGKLTFICQAQAAPKWLHKGTNTLAVRQPDYPELLELISQVGPIISTSANKTGQKLASDLAQAQDYFEDELDFYVDVGPLAGQPSTIIKKHNYQFEVLRQGEVKFKET